MKSQLSSVSRGYESMIVLRMINNVLKSNGRKFRSTTKTLNGNSEIQNFLTREIVARELKSLGQLQRIIYE